MRGLAWIAAPMALAWLGGCGETESDGQTAGNAGTAGSGATGGTGATGGVGASGGSPAGGAGGSAAVGGSSGVAGTAGSGAAAGTGGAPAECALLAYCDCRDRTDCKVEAEQCFCPCGVEPCTPDCDCACGGGNYLGCTPTSIASAGTLEGIWLIGWAGGLNHYSWVRLSLNGQAEFLDGAGIVGNAPIWCSGSGSWILTAQPETIGLTLPAACAGFESLTFAVFTPPSSYVKGSILAASLSPGPTGQAQEAYKFAPNQCDAALTSCTDPFL